MIFSLFKSKPTLKELIPEGFIDIHSHILPGIDDGAKNINESLELISELKELGFNKIIGTPHIYEGVHNNTNEDIESSFNELIKNDLKKIKVSYGAEYMLDMSIVKKASSNSLLCLKDSLVLVEMSYLSPPKLLFEILFELAHNGYTPVLAHPERYRFYHGSFKNYEKLKRYGCQFQLNLFSITDYYGKDVKLVSDKLLSSGFIDYVGSDIHKIKQIENFKSKVTISSINDIEKIIENTITVFN